MISDPQTWHPVLRWLLFLPVGFVATALVQGALRVSQWISSDGAYWGECLAVAAESWAFLMPALAVLPRFHRTFTLLFGIPYVAIQAVLIYLAFSRHSGFWSITWEVIIPLIGLISGSFAAFFLYERNAGADAMSVHAKA